MCRDGIRKVKAQSEVNLVRDMVNKKNGFYKYVIQKRKTNQTVLPLINEMGIWLQMT